MMGKAGADTDILVIGGGIVGVCASLELQARGRRVTLVDRRSPGRETSYGNAGVISRSSLIPINNPAMVRALPRLIAERSASLRVSLPFVLRNLSWTARFLANARPNAYASTLRALDSLIRLSADGHRALMRDANAGQEISDTGWIFLYRSERAFTRAAGTRDVLGRYGIANEVLTPDALRMMEPALRPIFARAVWVKDAMSVGAPGRVTEDYARLFAARGGRIEQREIATLESAGERWRATDATGRELTAQHVVVALGPWARRFLERMKVAVPIAYERGYHMHYGGPGGSAGNARLSRPVYDSDGGYVLAPMEHRLRLTTGVELNALDAPPRTDQLQAAERAARDAIDLGERTDKNAWLGRRPTTPDSRPLIGPVPRRRGLHLACAHQHIGFSTAPGTARLLADLIDGIPPPIPAAPFAPSRFIH